MVIVLPLSSVLPPVRTNVSSGCYSVKIKNENKLVLLIVRLLVEKRICGIEIGNRDKTKHKTNRQWSCVDFVEERHHD